MASAWAEPYGKGLWRARWRDPSDPTRKGSQGNFVSERTARQYARDQLEVAEAEVVATVELGPTYGEWVDRWMSARPADQSSLDRDEVSIETYLRPRWGQVHVGWFGTPEATAEIQRWVRDELDGRLRLAPATVRRVVGPLSSSLTAAIRDPDIPLTNHPIIPRKIAFPPPRPRVKRNRSRDQIALILDQLAGSVYWDLTCLFVASGLRVGELAGMHLSSVDRDRHRFGVATVFMTNQRLMKDHPKSPAGVRVVPVAEWAWPIVKRNYDLHEDEGGCGLPHVIDKKRTRRHDCRDPLLLRGPRGGPVDAHNFSQRVWRSALTAANEIDDSIGRITLHQLRHSFANWYSADGGDKADLQQILGHGAAWMTEYYADITNAAVERAQRVLDAAPAPWDRPAE